jgi:predicted alpha/beta superfamily hydrolase
MAIHILVTRPDMFQAYIAVSPSLCGITSALCTRRKSSLLRARN